MNALRRLLPLLPLLCCAACSESDATALRLQLRADLSGELQASALSLPEEPAPFETAAAGVEWRERARISVAGGRFTDLRALELSDLRFEGELRPEGLSFVRAHLPRGARARWFRLLTTADAERRQRAADALDAEGRAKLVGSTIKLVIEPPAPVVSSSAGPALRGMRSEAEQDAATLELPIDALAAEGEELVWTVIW